MYSVEQQFRCAQKRFFKFFSLLFMCKYSFQDDQHLQELSIEIFPHKYKSKNNAVCTL